MTTANKPPEQSNQQATLPANWGKYGYLCIQGFLFLVFGPIILHAWSLKKWIQASAWDEDERQQAIDGSAWFTLILYIPLSLFSLEITFIWTGLFTYLSNWTHLPLQLLAPAALWPPLSGTLFRWFYLLPCEYLLVQMLQLIDILASKSIVQPQRVLLPEEQQFKDAQKLKGTQTNQSSPASKKTRTPRATGVKNKSTNQNTLQKKQQEQRERTSPQSSPEDDYDWRSGEGSLPL